MAELKTRRNHTPQTLAEQVVSFFSSKHSIKKRTNKIKAKINELNSRLERMSHLVNKK